MPNRSPTHYALIEEGEEHLILDCITTSGMSSLRQIQSWANIGSDDERFNQTMLLSVDRKTFTTMHPQVDLSDQWISFHLQEHDRQSSVPNGGMVASFVSLGGGREDVQPIQFLVTAMRAVRRQLTKLSLMIGMNHRKTEIRQALDQEIDGEVFPLNVMVYDVGQGNANALVDEWGHPRLFFDLGWPDSFNQLTRPTDPPDLFAAEGNCTDKVAPVILSHWDFDHWAYAVSNTNYVFGKLAALMTFKPAALARDWIVPKPPRIGGGKGLGPTHMRLLAALPQRIAWPNRLKSVEFSAGIITRSDPAVSPKNRNNQGLAWFVKRRTSRNAILLPGDLSFDLLRWPPSPPEISGLVASHHAGLVTGIATAMLSAKTETKLAVSVGDGNKHGHPIATIETQYQTAMWKPSVLTSNRTKWGPSGKQNGAILLQLDATQPKPDFSCVAIVQGNMGPTQFIP